ncbi:MAG: squalene--hopene cyclase [Planctomycetes bacterium]|nr:squalene--hopene cyclase [Planctomycetota bacterium]
MRRSALTTSRPTLAVSAPSLVAITLAAAAAALAPQAAAPASAASAGDRAGDGDWETTPESEAALARGLEWLARNQGPDGSWESNDLGLVSLGALAFLAAGDLSGRGRHGAAAARALEFVLRNARPSGLLNIADGKRDMYNHGLAAFVLGQAHGMTEDPRLGPALDRALKLIAVTQCEDGGWDYHARRQRNGHDLSLAVMQAKALRSALDSGLEVPPETIELAVRSVRDHHRGPGGARVPEDAAARAEQGQFTYDGKSGTLAMAACGVVCLQELGQYGDWRIPRNLRVIQAGLSSLKARKGSGELPADAYTLYYVAQAVYQAGGRHWRECYPRLRDAVVENQLRAPGDPARDGLWRDGMRVSGKPGDLYGTAVACFVLSIPNRYLPILQESKLEGLGARLEER